MQRIALPPLEPRLQKRYVKLVQSHLHSAPKLAAGIASLPSVSSAFAATQAACRFLNNERIALSHLVMPIREVALAPVEASDSKFVILAHDWCKLTYDHPVRKRDLTQLTHENDIGYELTAALLINADNGSPLGPMELHLKTDDGILSTRERAPKDLPHLDQVLPTMKAATTWGLSKPCLHIIDREADSVGHYRLWTAQKHKFLIRGDDRRVRWSGKSWMLSEISEKLRGQRKFQCVGTAAYHGRSAQLWVAEAEVVLYRPAKRSVKGKKFEVPGPPITLRFIVTQIRNGSGKVLAEWKLLSNAPQDWATAQKLALCYYWRWRIESFFKLLKSHGQQLESWLQESGLAIARRLLIAAMACVIVWQLQADNSPKGMELKDILVRLSGRQMKRGRPHTAPALLAGLWSLLSMLALLEQSGLAQIQRLLNQIPYLSDTG